MTKRKKAATSPRRKSKDNTGGDKTPVGPIASKPYSPHPLALLFPALDEDAFDGLCADIDKNGQVHPIVALGDQILDGWHRYKACLKTGVAPMIHQFAGTNPAAYVLSANLHRRHLNLTTAQKRELIGQVLKESPELSDRQIGKITKTDNKTVASERAELESREEILTSETRTDSKGRKQPAQKPRQKAEGSIRTEGLSGPNPEKARDPWRADPDPIVPESDPKPANQSSALADADAFAKDAAAAMKPVDRRDEHTLDLAGPQPKANGKAGEAVTSEPEPIAEPAAEPEQAAAASDPAGDIHDEPGLAEDAEPVLDAQHVAAAIRCLIEAMDLIYIDPKAGGRLNANGANLLRAIKELPPHEYFTTVSDSVTNVTAFLMLLAKRMIADEREAAKLAKLAAEEAEKVARREAREAKKLAKRAAEEAEKVARREAREAKKVAAEQEREAKSGRCFIN